MLYPAVAKPLCPEQGLRVRGLLEAIDGLIDAMEGIEAPVTRELLATAITALVHECALARPAPDVVN